MQSERGYLPSGTRHVVTAPLHPLFVHFTVALSIVAYGFDLVASIFVSAPLKDVGCWVLMAALAITPVTVATGIRSRVRLPLEESAARAFLRTHMALGPIVLGALLAVTVWRVHLWQAGSGTPWTYLLAMSGVVLVVAVQGYLGGELVYRYGAEVKLSYRRLPEVSATGRPMRSGPEEGTS